MLGSASIFAIALSVVGLAQGLVVERAPSNEICYTTMGAQSVKDVSTSSFTVTSTATKTVVYYVQSKATIQPAAVTSTTIEVSTQVEIDSAGTETGTATVKSTAVSTVTKTVTLHPTTTKTKTITKTAHSTKTSTVATSSGFIPISSSLPNSNKARDLFQRQPKVSRGKGKFPQKVDCKNIETVTTTVTSTTTAAETITATALTEVQTATQVITSKVVVHPNAKVAVTSVASSTKTVTVTKTGSGTSTTITKTTTTTDVTPGPTVYAACGTQNLMPKYQGHVIDGVNSNDGTANEVLINRSSLYSCCAACFESSTCAIGYHDGDDSSDCWLNMNANNQCTKQKDFTYQAFSCDYNGYGAFNGNCGEVTSFVDYEGCD